MIYKGYRYYDSLQCHPLLLYLPLEQAEIMLSNDWLTHKSVCSVFIYYLYFFPPPSTDQSPDGIITRMEIPLELLCGLPGEGNEGNNKDDYMNAGITSLEHQVNDDDVIGTIMQEPVR